MSAIPKDDTMSRGELPRDNLSHSWRVPPTLTGWPIAANGDSAAAPCDPLRAHLRTLGLLRLTLGSLLLAAAVVLTGALQVPLPIAPMLASLATIGAAEAARMTRLRRPGRVGEAEYLAHLLVDLLWLANVIYWSGGSLHNPFADTFVLYAGLAAMVLPVRHVLATSLTALMLYALLGTFHHHVELVHAGVDGQSLETAAHYAHFLVLCGIVAFFGYRLSAATRRNGQLEAESRERAARSESAVSLAALAAGTAHEMGTPLTTVAMLAGDLRKCELSPEERHASAEAITKAVQSCKQSLAEMVEAIGVDRLNETRRIASRQLLEQLVERLSPARPSVPVAVAIECPETSLIEISAPLRQALLNLVTNAADASPQGIELRLRCWPAEVQIDVLDRGPGIPESVLDKLGTCFVTTKGSFHGTGVGVFLANMTISRLGGRLEYLPRNGGGTCARVTLPTIDA
jgi:two-component system, sensor histidine kinase RegB